MDWVTDWVTLLLWLLGIVFFVWTIADAVDRSEKLWWRPARTNARTTRRKSERPWTSSRSVSWRTSRRERRSWSRSSAAHRRRLRDAAHARSPRRWWV